MLEGLVVEVFYQKVVDLRFCVDVLPQVKLLLWRQFEELQGSVSQVYQQLGATFDLIQREIEDSCREILSLAKVMQDIPHKMSLTNAW